MYVKMYTQDEKDSRNVQTFGWQRVRVPVVTHVQHYIFDSRYHISLFFTY